MTSQSEEVKNQPQMADGSRSGNTHSGSIDFRGHVSENKRVAGYTTLYAKGERVYLKQPRGPLKGPYIVDVVNADGTYCLTKDGQVVDGVKEEALKLDPQ